MKLKEFQRSSGNIVSIVFLLFLLTVLLVAIWQKQDVIDWWKLRDYTPNASVKSLADATSMTDFGRRLFYINQPELLTGSSFSHQCDFGKEKTIVLGCYAGNDRGIFLYKVEDPRLDGVIQTTAAHEMLHAAYNRLNSKERAEIDNELAAYYRSIKDDRLIETIDAYNKSEPDEIANEMHSIFGTEVSTLPITLEKHYQKYFKDRKTVVRLSEKYQYEFTSRRKQAAIYDSDLAALKSRIDANELILRSKERILIQQYKDLQSLRETIDSSQYNLKVHDYNNDVQNYNNLITEAKSQIAEFNSIVKKRNDLALEERELTQALSSKNL